MDLFTRGAKDFLCAWANALKQWPFSKWNLEKILDEKKTRTWRVIKEIGVNRTPNGLPKITYLEQYPT